MKKAFLLILLTWPLLVTASPDIDDRIAMALEEPAANSTVSGVGNLRGWAVGPDGIDYVEFYVDGVLRKEIPYGAARGDIGNAYPGFPDSLYSGFSSAYAYGLLNPGTHVLKVRAVSSNNKYKEASNTFEVTRFHKGYFPDPNAMDISSSSCSQDGTGFLVNNLRVEGIPYNARLEWQVPSQQFSIVKITAEEPPPQTGFSPLNDTGIVDCGDYQNNDLACPVATHPGQDAEYGRDVTHNDDSDGHAGFSFTKRGTECVKDNVTGLTWEVKTDDGGLHDKDDSYQWYNTDSTSNGGHPGYADLFGTICYGSDSADPATFCNTQTYVARVNQAGWCGHKDWRMPTREELRSLVDYSISYPGPPIDTDYFPNDPGSGVWSSSPHAKYSNYAWILFFGRGTSDGYHKGLNEAVRLVRGG